MDPLKVISCTEIKKVNDKPVFKVGLSDGRFGESFGKDVPVGTTAEKLDISEGQYGLKIKLKSQGGGGWPGKQHPERNASFALSYAKDVASALIHKSEKEFKSTEITKVILTMAQEFYKWMEERK